MARIGFVLSGAGFQDGTEIQEAVTAMMCLEEAGAELVYFAPDKDQTLVVSHQSGETQTTKRNVREESARISRGHVQPLSEARAEDLDGVVMPGGFGAALNLSDFGQKGSQMTVDSDLERLLTALHAAQKPIGAICIAPVILAKVFGPHKPSLTIGNDKEAAAAVMAMGATHVDCTVSDIVVDANLRLVSTPAYMLAKGPGELRTGIGKLVTKVLDMCAR